MKVKYDGLYRIAQDNPCIFLSACHSVMDKPLVE